MIKYKNTLLGKVSNMLKGRRMHFLQHLIFFSPEEFYCFLNNHQKQDI